MPARKILTDPAAPSGGSGSCGTRRSRMSRTFIHSNIGSPSRAGDLVVRQLGNPQGLFGRAILRSLNRSNRQLIQGCVQAIAPRTGDLVADIGFGGGIGIAMLADRVGLTGIVTGVEPSGLARTNASKRYKDEITLDRIRILSGVVSQLPLSDDSQDGVISVNTVYFWADVDVGLREIFRVLAPGGSAAIGIGRTPEQERLKFEVRAKRIVEPSELVHAMTGVGFIRVSAATPRGPDGPSIVRGYRPGEPLAPHEAPGL